MAIYDFSTKPREEEAEEFPLAPQQVQKASLFAALSSRLLFLLLLGADLLWMGYTLASSLVLLPSLFLASGKKRRASLTKKWIALRRSLVCAVALVVALFSPSFGVMVACTYFLMYDKSGIDEVVPTVLRSEFKDLLPKPQH